MFITLDFFFLGEAASENKMRGARGESIPFRLHECIPGRNFTIIHMLGTGDGAGI